MKSCVICNDCLGEDIDSILVGIIQVNGTENTSDFQFLQNESESTLFRGNESFSGSQRRCNCILWQP